VRLSVPTAKLGRLVSCPKCHFQFEASGNLVPDADVIVVGRESGKPNLPSLAPTQTSSIKAGRVCSILSLIFGGVGFLIPFVGFAGLALGILGVCLSKRKAEGLLGITISIMSSLLGLLYGGELGELLIRFLRGH